MPESGIKAGAALSANLRISIVSETWFPQVNGVSRTLDRLAGYLAEQGDQVQLLVPRYQQAGPPLPAAIEKRQWSGFRLPFYREVQLPVVRPASIRAALQQFRPHLVHIATEGPLGWAALQAARSAKLPVVSSYHTNFPQYLKRYRVGALEPVAWRYLRWFHNATHMTFCPTPRIRQTLLDQGFNNVRVWGRGVDNEAFHPRFRDAELRRRLGFAPEDVVLAYVGRLAAEKNLELLFSAWEQLPCRERCRLLLIGDGPLRKELERRAGERICFAGYRHGEELARMYAAADLFVFPSVTETFGNVLLEAMASGLPAVGFRAPGPLDLIREGETGRLVPETSAAGLAALLEELLRDPSQLIPMGQRARSFAETQSWSGILAGLRSDYQSVLETRFQA